MKTTHTYTLLVAALLSAQAQGMGNEKFHVGPSGKNGMTEFNAVFLEEAEWDYTKLMAHGFRIGIESITNWSLQDLNTYVPVVANLGLQPSVEVAGIHPLTDSCPGEDCDEAGEECARIDALRIAEWLYAEPRDSVEMTIIMDHPFQRGVDPDEMNLDIESTKQEILDYMVNLPLETAARLVVLNAVDPPVVTWRFGWIEPVPHFRVGSYPAYDPLSPAAIKWDAYYLDEVVEDFLEFFEQEGRPVDFFLADSPYNFSNGTMQSSVVVGWDKLRVLEDVAHANGVGFGWFANSKVVADDGPCTPGAASQYHDEVLLGLAAMDAAGVEVDEWYCVSWYKCPDPQDEETTAGSFMNTARDFLLEATKQVPVTSTFHDETLGLLEPQGSISTHYSFSNNKLSITDDCAFATPHRYGDVEAAISVGPGQPIDSRAGILFYGETQDDTPSSAGDQVYAYVKRLNQISDANIVIRTTAGVVAQTWTPLSLGSNGYELRVRITDNDVECWINGTSILTHELSARPRLPGYAQLRVWDISSGDIDVNYCMIRPFGWVPDVYQDEDGYIWFSFLEEDLADSGNDSEYTFYNDYDGSDSALDLTLAQFESEVNSIEGVYPAGVVRLTQTDDVWIVGVYALGNTNNSLDLNDGDIMGVNYKLRSDVLQVVD